MLFCYWWLWLNILRDVILSLVLAVMVPFFHLLLSLVLRYCCLLLPYKIVRDPIQHNTVFSFSSSLRDTHNVLVDFSELMFQFVKSFYVANWSGLISWYVHFTAWSISESLSTPYLRTCRCVYQDSSSCWRIEVVAYEMYFCHFLPSCPDGLEEEREVVGVTEEFRKRPKKGLGGFPVLETWQD